MENNSDLLITISWKGTEHQRWKCDNNFLFTSLIRKAETPRDRFPSRSGHRQKLSKQIAAFEGQGGDGIQMRFPLDFAISPRNCGPLMVVVVVWNKWRMTQRNVVTWTCRGITCNWGSLVSAVCHHWLRYVSSSEGNMVSIRQDSSNRRHYSSSVTHRQLRQETNSFVFSEFTREIGLKSAHSGAYCNT